MMVHMMILQSFADFKLVFGLIPVPGMPPNPPLNEYIFAAVVIIYSLICAPALLIHAPTSSTIFPELNAHLTKKAEGQCKHTMLFTLCQLHYAT